MGKRKGRYHYDIMDNDKKVDFKELQNKYKTGNSYDLSGEYGIGFTDNGEQFLFDLEDYDVIKNYKWKFDEDGYVMTSWDKTTHKHIHLLFHRLVMGVVDNHDYMNCQVDHIHHKKYDNRKSELRICTAQQNLMNQKSYDKHGNKIGVNLENGKWVANIIVQGKRIILGKFTTYEEAVQARIDGEKKYRGEFAGV